MAAQIGRASAPSWDPQWPDSGARDEFAALFETHAANVFDYCSSLLGYESEAAAATQATLVAAYMFIGRLDSRFRLRAWLLALARSECSSKHPARAEPLPPLGLDDSELTTSWQREGTEITDAGPGKLSADGEAAARLKSPALAALAGLPGPQREALELVYRHGVPPAELPAILGTSEDHAQAELTAAVARFEG